MSSNFLQQDFFGTNLGFQMEQYIYKWKSDGTYIINLKRTWEKLLLAARAIENPAEFCAYVAPTPTSTCGRSCLTSTSIEGPEETEKEEQAAAENAVTKEQFQGEWTASAAEFTASQPEVADLSEGMQVPSVSTQQFPTEDESAQPATEGWSAALLLRQQNG
ncbi:hypothetical protein mRhiFer1_007953 [Rhinolophus ferrumequinum]|uniref:Small ribosomal subunit protein uS2 C-terminal domain-containing protein n=1 Tax=Rhinolophus ferrumequinum TaxID=59479 RepID=A0A7J8AVE7_RHIFE|nr:hypothetical protein mRhiFer1_007953 [Rhinolophus ferrumequinum]